LAEIDGMGDELLAEDRCIVKDTFETGHQSSSYKALLFAVGATIPLILLEASSQTPLETNDEFTSEIPESVTITSLFSFISL